MRAWSFLVALAALLAGCTAGSEAPDWSPGTTYSFEVGTFSHIVHQFELPGEDPYQEEQGSLEPRFKPWTSYEMVSKVRGEPDVFLTRVDSGGYWSALGIRIEDLAPMPTRVSYGPACPQPGCGAVATDISFELPPDGGTWLQFPLQEDATWKHFVHNKNPAGPSKIAVEATVLPRVQAPGPHGPVTVVPVEHRLQIESRPQEEEQVRRLFEAAGARDVAASVEHSWTVVVAYAPDLQNVVDRTTTMDMHIRVEGMFSDGPFRIETHTSDGLVHRMRDVALRSGPEPSWDEVLAMFDAPGHHGLTARTYAETIGFWYAEPEPMVPVPELAVQKPAPDPVVVPLQVRTDASRINVAQPVDVAISIGGVPEGSTVSYQIQDAAGTIVAEGSGIQSTYTFAEPGRYRILAEARDGMQSTGRGAATVVADYSDRQDVRCSVAVVGDAVGSCTESSLPVRPGIDQIHIKYTPEQLAAGGTIQLTDPTGTMWSAPIGSSGASLEIDDLEGAAVGSDWTLSIRPTVQLFGGEVEIDLLFGPDAQDGGSAYRFGSPSAPDIAQSMLQALGLG